MTLIVLSSDWFANNNSGCGPIFPSWDIPFEITMLECCRVNIRLCIFI
jgi:hypothetical protein